MLGPLSRAWMGQEEKATDSRRLCPLGPPDFRKGQCGALLKCEALTSPGKGKLGKRRDLGGKRQIESRNLTMASWLLEDCGSPGEY